jgi:hypothetical protein
MFPGTHRSPLVPGGTPQGTLKWRSHPVDVVKRLSHELLQVFERRATTVIDGAAPDHDSGRNVRAHKFRRKLLKYRPPHRGVDKLGRNLCQQSHHYVVRGARATSPQASEDPTWRPTWGMTVWVLSTLVWVQVSGVWVQVSGPGLVIWPGGRCHRSKCWIFANN